MYRLKGFTRRMFQAAQTSNQARTGCLARDARPDIALKAALPTRLVKST